MSTNKTTAVIINGDIKGTVTRELRGAFPWTATTANGTELGFSVKWAAIEFLEGR